MIKKDHESKQQKGEKMAVVGPCGASKSTLVQTLSHLGYNIRSVSQEHSYVADMWQRITKPNRLIYLDVTLETIAQRRSIDWGQKRLDQLNHRLRHARAHCHFYLATDKLSTAEVVELVKQFLEARRDKPQDEQTDPEG